MFEEISTSDEIQAADQDFSEELIRLDMLGVALEEIATEGVSRPLMASLESAGISIDKNYPVESYTMTPSDINLTVSMEGIISNIFKGLGKSVKLVVGVIRGVVGLMSALFVKIKTISGKARMSLTNLIKASTKVPAIAERQESFGYVLTDSNTKMNTILRNLEEKYHEKYQITTDEALEASKNLGIGEGLINNVKHEVLKYNTMLTFSFCTGRSDIVSVPAVVSALKSATAVAETQTEAIDSCVKIMNKAKFKDDDDVSEFLHKITDLANDANKASLNEQFTSNVRDEVTKLRNTPSGRPPVAWTKLLHTIDLESLEKIVDGSNKVLDKAERGLEKLEKSADKFSNIQVDFGNLSDAGGIEFRNIKTQVSQFLKQRRNEIESATTLIKTSGIQILNINGAMSAAIDSLNAFIAYMNKFYADACKSARLVQLQNAIKRAESVYIKNYNAQLHFWENIGSYFDQPTNTRQGYVANLLAKCDRMM